MNSGIPPLKTITIYLPIGSPITDVSTWLYPYYYSEGSSSLTITADND